MKHPTHSKAKNQYAGRSATKISKEKKEELYNEVLPSFNVRLKAITDRIRKEKENKIIKEKENGIYSEFALEGLTETNDTEKL